MALLEDLEFFVIRQIFLFLNISIFKNVDEMFIGNCPEPIIFGLKLAGFHFGALAKS